MPYIAEVALEGPSLLNVPREAFNDQSLIVFPQTKLITASSDVWEDNKEETPSPDADIIFADHFICQHA